MEVSEELFQYFTTALTAMATPEPFALHFHHASFGPSETAPRLIWATGDTTPELTQLKETLEKTITYKPDHNFLPHITLARFSQTDFEMSPLKDLHEDIHWKMLVEEFVIMESKQLPTGSDYPVLARFPLTGTQQ